MNHGSYGHTLLIEHFGVVFFFIYLYLKLYLNSPKLFHLIDHLSSKSLFKSHLKSFTNILSIYFAMVYPPNIEILKKKYWAKFYEKQFSNFLMKLKLMSEFGNQICELHKRYIVKFQSHQQ